jgi:hypothetical protein
VGPRRKRGRGNRQGWRLRLRKGVFSANVRGKLFVPLQLEVLQQFIKRFASGRTRRFEQPGAFGAAPTMKTVFLDPYELAPRRHLYAKDKILDRNVSYHYLLPLNLQND